METLDDSHDLLELLERFRRVYPRLEVLEQDPGVIVTRCVASDKQKGAFSRVLVRISNELKDDDLEILVALCPTPEGRKDALISGVKLFDELQCHGCITEDNTDLLEDLFRVLKLHKPAALLAEYRTVRVTHVLMCIKLLLSETGLSTGTIICWSIGTSDVIWQWRFATPTHTITAGSGSTWLS